MQRLGRGTDREPGAMADKCAVNRRDLLAVAVAGMVSGTPPASAARNAHLAQVNERPGLRILKNTLVWDNHSCMPLRPDDTSFLDQLERHRSVGTDIVILNVSFDALPWSFGFKMLASLRSWIKARPDDYLLVSSVDDIELARQSDRLGVAFDLEGGVAVDDLPDLVEVYYALGVRWMLIAYNKNNRLGGGGQDEDTGLTEFGRRVIRRMEDVGMVLCCSHTGYRTAHEAIDYSANPVIFSHSNPLTLRDHPRNITDDLMRACAQTGGVININGIGEFLGRNDNRTETIVRHIQYTADLVGPDHIGIGLDYVFDSAELDAYIMNNPDLFPADADYSGGAKMVEPERLPEIVENLLARGWSEGDLKKLLGENNLRVARQVWKPV